MEFKDPSIHLRTRCNITSLFRSDSRSKLDSSKGSFLNEVILTLPDRYLGGITKSQRADFLIQLSSRDLLDYNHGFLEYYPTPSYVISGDASLYIKLLPGAWPDRLVFVNLTFEDFIKNTRKNENFVLEQYGDDWKDITGEVMPRGVDLTAIFIPQHKTQIIDVGRSEDGMRMYQLMWNGTSFDAYKASKKKLED